MKLKHSYILIFSFLLTGFGVITNSCKKRKQEIPPYVSVTLNVKDEKNEVIDTATAYLYSSKEAFDAAYNNSLKGIYNSTGSIQVGKVLKGQLVFPEIPANQPYWILIHDSSQTFKGINVPEGIRIHRDNSESNFYINQYQNGTQILANIKLKPINALIKLSNPDGITSFDTLEISTPHKKYTNGADEFLEVRTGEVPYFIRDNICIWTGAIQAAGGVVTNETLAKCNQAGIKFIYNEPLVKDSIMIYLGQNKTRPVSVLKAGRTNQIIYVSLESNINYNYFAVMVNGKKCIWDTLVSPTAARIVDITLKPCY